MKTYIILIFLLLFGFGLSASNDLIGIDSTATLIICEETVINTYPPSHIEFRVDNKSIAIVTAEDINKMTVIELNGLGSLISILSMTYCDPEIVDYIAICKKLLPKWIEIKE